MPHTINYINTKDSLDKLSKLLDSLKESDYLSLDTEFTRVKTFYPILNLIQICIEDEVYLIDSMADIDLTPFMRSLCSCRGRVLLFSAREDLEILSYEAFALDIKEGLPQNCIDVQTLLAFFNVAYMQGLQTAIFENLGVELKKDQTLSDWSVRPLSEEQIKYAADDVLYLKPLFEKVLNGREDDQRFKWFHEEMQNARADAMKSISPEEAYLSVAGAGTLNLKELNVLRYLCKKRYEFAMEHDESLNRVITGKALCPISRLSRISNEAVLSNAGMKWGSIRSHGKMVMTWHKEALKEPVDESIILPYDCYASNRDYQKPMRTLRHILSQAASRSGICRELLCSKSIINDYFYKRHYSKAPLVQTSWYAECVGTIDHEKMLPLKA